MISETPRYSHEEGDVSVCYDNLGQHIITCGSDGVVRIFEGFEDDEPVCHTVGDVAYTVAFKNHRFYVATDANSLMTYIFKDGPQDGLLTRSTAPVTCVHFNTDGSKAVVGSSDCSVKLVSVSNTTQSHLWEHAAPVLHVAFNRQDSLLASSGCDGTLVIYDIEKQETVKKISCFPKSNDVSKSTTAARFDWSSDGKFLFVPSEKDVTIYDTTSWQICGSLASTDLSTTVSIATVSPCGQYLAATSQNGLLMIFDLSTRKLINSDRHKKKLKMTGLAWNPVKKGEIAWVDCQGNLGLYTNVLPSLSSETKAEVKSAQEGLTAEELKGLFDDSDDELWSEASQKQGVAVSTAPKPDVDDGEMDFVDALDDIDKLEPGNVTHIEDDDLSLDGRSSVSGTDRPPSTTPASALTQVTQCKCEHTPVQPAFQPSSTSVYFSHRFMVWNNVGLILQYTTEEENSINVEFHDVATHHALHITNTLGHTMADLSSQAVLMACPAGEETPSTVMCLYFASWDSNKEWTVELPEGEEAEALCMGNTWGAVATDARLIRLFSVAGLQLEVLSLSGPVVALASYDNFLFVAYHKATGLKGDQCLGCLLLNVKSKKCLLSGVDLPLTRKSTLVWLGFTAEGSPCYCDSEGNLRMLNRNFLGQWTPIANTKSQTKGKSDNFWLVGVYEATQQIRAVLVKGGQYPHTLPRPTLSILPMQLPMSDTSTEKGNLEENLWRVDLLSGHLNWRQKQGLEEEDSSLHTQLLMAQQEALMKLFALACRSGREARAVEVCELMSSTQTVQLAIKYASRLRMTGLAQRLADVARMKAEASHEEEEEEEEESMKSELPLPSRQRQRQVSPAPSEDIVEDASSKDDQSDVDDEDNSMTGPTLKVKQFKELTPRSIADSQKEKKNPFKMKEVKEDTKASAAASQGSKIFDRMEAPRVTKPLKPKPGDTNKKQLPVKLKTKEKLKNTDADSSSTGPQSGFSLWLNSQRDELSQEFPDQAEDEITVTAARRWKDLSAEAKKEWNNKAKVQSAQDKSAAGKRKHSDDENTDTSARKKIVIKKSLSSSTTSKLSNFAFSK